MFAKFIALILIAMAIEASFISGVAEIQNEEPNIYRLPNNVEPKYYVLRMIPDLSAFTFSGNVEITITVKYATNIVKLHSKNLKILRYELKNAKNQVLQSKVNFDVRRDLLLIQTKEKLVREEHKLFISFEGKLNDNFIGFHRSSYTENNKKMWFAITSFQPNYAREAFPCFDEPRFQTRFKVYLARKSHQCSMSNTFPLKSTKNDETDDLIWDEYDEMFPTPTYLVTFVIGEPFCTFQMSNEKNMPPVAVHSRPSLNKNTKYISTQSLKIYQQLKDYLQESSFLQRLDFMAIPNMKFAVVQNWGLPILREIYVILDEESCPEIQRSMVTMAASHELAGQWFGAAVNPDWWDSAWIVNGLACYFEYFITAKIEPDWRMDERFIFEQVQSSLWTEIECQRAMSSPVTKPSQMGNLYNVVIWDKASCIFRMLENIIRSKGFGCGLRILIKNKATNFENTLTAEKLFEAFETQPCQGVKLPSGSTLTEILRTWTDNIGFPLITVTKDSTKNRIIFQQTTYRSVRASKPLPDQEWIVPLTYTTKSEMQFGTIPTLWLTGNAPVESLDSVSSSDWVLCNLQQFGYYRVTYDLSNWELLITQLKEDHEKIPVINRAQLLDDSFALAYDDKLDFSIPLKLAKYLEKENHMLPWQSAINHLNLIFAELYETKHVNMITTYIEALIGKLYDRFGFKINPSDCHLFKIGYPSILSLAGKIEMRRCIADSSNEYSKNIKDLNKIQPDLKSVVFCNVLANAQNPDEVWNNLWNLYKTNDSPYLKVTILSNLGCTKDENVFKKTLSKLLDAKEADINNTDKLYVINSILQMPSGITTFMNILKEESFILGKYDQNGLLILESIIKRLERKIFNQKKLELLNSIHAKFEGLKGNRYTGLKKHLSKIYTKAPSVVRENESRAIKIVLALQQLGISNF